MTSGRFRFSLACCIAAISPAAFLFGAATWVPDDVAEEVTQIDGRSGVLVALWNEIILILISLVFMAFAARRIGYCFRAGFVVFATTHCLLAWTSSVFMLHTLLLIAAVPIPGADEIFFYFGTDPNRCTLLGSPRRTLRPMDGPTAIACFPLRM